jgi:phage replication O-like protein O
LDFKRQDRFLRVPNAFFDALLALRLSGTEWRILLWVIRQTLGWNRTSAPFSWYRMAQDLQADRGGVVRAGHRLMRAGLIVVEANEIRIQQDAALWCALATSHGQALTNVSADQCPRKAMTGISASDDDRHRKRGPASSVFRRAKDSKDNLNTKKDMRHLAPQEGGKYDRLSEN